MKNRKKRGEKQGLRDLCNNIRKSNIRVIVVQEEREREIKGRKQFAKKNGWGFPGGTVVKNPPANAGDTGSSPGPGRSHMLQSN